MERTVGRGVREFDFLLWLAMLSLALATIVLPAGVLVGWGDFFLDGTLARPFAVTIDGGRAIEVTESGDVIRHNFRRGDIEHSVEAPPRVLLKARVDGHDLDTRVALCLSSLVALGFAWLGLLNLRRVVRSARDGDPFVAANVRRLRRVALAVFALPIVERIAAWVLDGTFDNDVDLHVRPWGPSFMTCVVVAVGLLALANVFRDGVALRELEQGTV